MTFTTTEELKTIVASLRIEPGKIAALNESMGKRENGMTAELQKAIADPAAFRAYLKASK